MSKSFWFKDWPAGNGQKGNFSNNKQDTFNPKEGFIGTRLQQGVPLLDRDWNELEDIRRYQDVVLRKHYLGDGTPNDGFRISALDSPANDFMISAGRFLVDGFEAVNEPAGANFVLYSSQTGAPPLTRVKATVPPSTVIRIDTVYLDIWIEEVTGADLPRLKNPGDVAMETCIRHRLRWSVRVDEGSLGHIPGEGHHFYDLAKITRTTARDTIASADIDDLRSNWQILGNTQSTQSRLLNALKSLASGNMPSGPTIDLATFLSTGQERRGHPYVVKDDLGNMILSWVQDNNVWAKRYSASTRTWGAETQITSGTDPKFLNVSFSDSRGDTWVFWGQQEGNIDNYWVKRYSTSTGVWTDDVRLTSGALYKEVKNVFEDSKGNVWFFWGVREDFSPNPYYYYNFWAKRYTSGIWSVDYALTTGRDLHFYGNSFGDGNGIIWFFWEQDDNIQPWYKRFVSGSWIGGAPVSSTGGTKRYFHSFMDARGDVWLFWKQFDQNYNYWAKRFTANTWGNEMQLTGGSTDKIPYAPIAGAKGDVFFIYSLAEADNVSNINAERFNFDINGWESIAITNGAGDKFVDRTSAFSNGDLGFIWVNDNDYAFNMFSKSDLMWLGNIRVANALDVYFYKVLERSNEDKWFLLSEPPYYNLSCVRFIDGNWKDKLSLTSGTSLKEIIDVFESVTGEIWAFWMTKSSNQSIPRQIKAKKIYDFL